MVQKKVTATKVRKPANGPKNKKTFLKSVLETEVAIGASKLSPKKNKKPPIQQAAASDEDSDASENAELSNVDEGSNSEAENQNEDESSEDESDLNDDDEPEPGEVSLADQSKLHDEAEFSDEEEENNLQGESESSGDEGNDKPEGDDDSNDDDDDAPEEVAITKEKPSKIGGIPKITVGKIPADIPQNQIIFVSQLPHEYKHNELVGVFSKFGPIKIVGRVKTTAGGSNVRIAFQTADAAGAALNANVKALTLNGQNLKVAPATSKETFMKRTVVVSLIKAETTEDELKAHFKKVGPIDCINFTKNTDKLRAYIRFESEDSVAPALKLNGSQLGSRFITVRSIMTKIPKSNDCTLILNNTGKHESFKTATIEKIFKKYGELLDVEVICTSSTLAFITYKNAGSTQKAWELNGKTVGDLTVELRSFYVNSCPLQILVTNLTQVSESELRELFKASGEIENINMFGRRAVIKFETTEGFCNSFLLNEAKLGGKPIFIEPNSIVKHKTLLQFKNPNFGRKPVAAGRFGPRGKGPGGKGPGRNGPGGKGPGGFSGPAKYDRFPNKKPFNKRSAQENGSTPQFNKRAKKA
ncbi:DNA-binding protein modulo isoform X2 [Scaptodrosophila lebanonensis]|uniref:DNA-binding protein modulo isoform X2 n=1 Tax=Drosophila lebanonensis TaxID=7225 RepID=A0A6J2T339_DROLE|nr:DNA-binding protein modulo isoform X2 [Scaptodrosophila lebanonensis]